ncbi:hypothetical protein J7E88_18040 [Streptomyces sp. ISL-10]|uniref:hypothetical protein n=1 Tax=Streptomyces sp. ISL-10 TaxID=2819172 RepID=UPI001BEBF8F6|nr:hypothetical protein [Streptomyces sp. ISL-10]MBT2367157.1 hypothetical protein [Streptomyces sp. ISL-10]
MTPETGVIIGAAIAAVAGVVGSLIGLANARTAARAQIAVVELQAAAHLHTEATAKRREAYAAVGAAVEASRRQFSEMVRIIQTSRRDPNDRERLGQRYDAAEAERDARIQELHNAEWTLRLMLPAEEQAALTTLLNAVYTATSALDEWGGWVFADHSPEATRAAYVEYSKAMSTLHTELMEFAARVHSLLFATPAQSVSGLSQRLRLRRGRPS